MFYMINSYKQYYKWVQQCGTNHFEPVISNKYGLFVQHIQSIVFFINTLRFLHISFENQALSGRRHSRRGLFLVKKGVIILKKDVVLYSLVFVCIFEGFLSQIN